MTALIIKDTYLTTACILKHTAYSASASSNSNFFTMLLSNQSQKYMLTHKLVHHLLTLTLPSAL